MELSRLIAELSLPAAYPEPADQFEVRQTHISVVFLVGQFVYKIRKPVRLEFLDFSTLELRRQDCEHEVQLNARLAADVYLGVVPIAADGEQLRIAGRGPVVEWAVKMRRLPDEATWENRLGRGEIDVEDVRRLAEKIARFHAGAARGPHISQFGQFAIVASNARDNLSQSHAQIGVTLSAEVENRIRRLCDRELERLRELIERRAANGVPCDTHGDLRLDHVYQLADRQPPDDLVILDCIEFNEKFRYADPVADMAFLAMDLKFHGRADLADEFSQTYFRAAGDDEGRALLSFYLAYRAMVRAKVAGLKLAQREISAADHRLALQQARGYWLLALAELSPAAERPCLILVGGLPGAGKSTLARRLADRGGFQVIRSDIVRKQLAGLSAAESAPGDFGQGLYSSDWNDRAYAECLRLAQERLFAGERVIVDASFREDARRREFLQAATAAGVPGRFFLCQADVETIRRRITARQGDASDADWSIYQQAASRWEPLSPPVSPSAVTIDTSGSAEAALDAASADLRTNGLL